MPGPIGAVVGAVCNLGPIPRWLGLEPPPKGAPTLHQLDFSWNEIGSQEFGTRMDEMEARLGGSRTALGKRGLVAAGNSKYLVSLDTGVTAVWDPRGDKPSTTSRTQLGKEGEAQREVAAYVVDKHLGHFARIPPQVIAELDGRPGTLNLFVPASSYERNKSSLETMDRGDYRRLALFDHIIGNLDRHDSNWLLDDQGRPVPIDHGLSFPLENRDQGFHNFCFDQNFDINAEEKALLQSFLERRDEVEQDLRPLLQEKAIEAMFERVERILETGRVTQWWRA